MPPRRSRKKQAERKGPATEPVAPATPAAIDADQIHAAPEPASELKPESSAPFHSGFVAIIGLPNAGKSTLVNQLVGHKIAIVSTKPQTTRNRIVGIVHRPGAQIVLVDTPGLHRPSNSLGRHMLEEIEKGTEGVDLLAVIADATRPFGREDRFPIERARRFSGPAFLLLNKIDRTEKPRLLPLIDAYRREHDWAEIIPISALTGQGIGVLAGELVRYLPEGPPYFPADQFTDQPERFLAAELVREKALALTEQEVPYSIGVAIDRFVESGRMIHIYATILVEREGQKGILIGKGGAMMKKIGTQARLDLEHLLGTKIYLEIFVKVQPGWRDNPSLVDRLDWRREFEELSG
ncbi:MAG TPA: GTPase Era [Patescibacteria group bacterium]|nr:GTPase Era [Patescibacteria group bacterium]